MATVYVEPTVTGLDIDAKATAIAGQLNINSATRVFAGGKIDAILIDGTTSGAITDAIAAVGDVAIIDGYTVEV